MMSRLQEWDFAILDWIVEHIYCGWLDQLMPFITKLGDAGIIWIVLAIIMICIPKERSKGVQILLALGFSFILCNLLLKNLVGRIRPFELKSGIELLIQAPIDFSFPSGHTSASFAAFMVLLMHRWKGRYYILVLAILIGFSRLYLYVHFLSDVLAGGLTGIGSGYLAVKIYELIRQKRLGKPRGGKPDVF